MFGFGGQCNKGPGGSCGNGAPHEKCAVGAVLSKLDLSDDQLIKLAELKGEAFGHCAQLKLGFMGLFKQIVKALLAEEIDKAKVKDVAKQLLDMKVQAMQEMPDRLIAMAEVFTPAQRKHLRLAIIRHFLGMSDCQ